MNKFILILALCGSFFSGLHAGWFDFLCIRSYFSSPQLPLAWEESVEGGKILAVKITQNGDSSKHTTFFWRAQCQLIKDGQLIDSRAVHTTGDVQSPLFRESIKRHCDELIKSHR